MTTRWQSIAVALALGALPLAAAASDAPHNSGGAPGAAPVNCTSCHQLHNATGSVLTNYTAASVSNLCASCHTTANFGFPYLTGDQAVPGGSGDSHRWDTPISASWTTASPGPHGATYPTNTAMVKHLQANAGTLNCEVCHDQHNGATLYGGAANATQHVSAVAHTVGTGAGAVTVVSPVGATAAAKGYRLGIVVGGAVGVSTFRISHDGGASWIGWSGAAWVAGNANGRPTAASVQLDDGTNVSAAFAAGTYVAGDAWDFYVSYPFLRASNTNSAMCYDCHKQRVQTYRNVEGVAGGNLATITLGTTLFSHPVTQGLNANGGGYDRANQNAILDATGLAQGPTGDGNKTNDLNLDNNAAVDCMTCHYMHATDSNSLSVHPR